MNNERRKQIAAIVELLEQIELQTDDVRTLATEEREAFDSLPESLQQSERGERSSEAADALEEAADALEEIASSLEDAIAALNRAAE